MNAGLPFARPRARTIVAPAVRSVVPTGLHRSRAAVFPAINRWAILTCPSGAARPASLPDVLPPGDRIRLSSGIPSDKPLGYSHMPLRGGASGVPTGHLAARRPNTVEFSRPYGTPSLAGGGIPSDESLGYSHMPLRGGASGVPAGRLAARRPNTVEFSRPYGTELCAGDSNPAINRWATFGRPSGAKPARPEYPRARSEDRNSRWKEVRVHTFSGSHPRRAPAPEPRMGRTAARR
jgi:hypothetical protein